MTGYNRIYTRTPWVKALALTPILAAHWACAQDSQIESLTIYGSTQAKTRNYDSIYNALS